MLKQYRFLRMMSTLLLLGVLLGVSLVACGNSTTNSGNTGANGTAATTTPSLNATSVPANTPGQPAQSVLTVTSVDISVQPASLASYPCGTQLTVTYTATFHFSAHNSGGQVMFQWTTNNGRGSTQASLNVPAGASSMPFPFTWSGQLPADHTEPGPGGVLVTSPNAYTSPLVGPTGSCSTAQTVPLKVTSVGITVSPSLSSFTCGTNVTVTYTATFHFPANNAGGQVMFEYTTTNGRGSSPASITVPPGTTTLAYSFQWKGTIYNNQPDPGAGGVLVTSPNAYTSPLVGPTGACH